MSPADLCPKTAPAALRIFVSFRQNDFFANGICQLPTHPPRQVAVDRDGGQTGRLDRARETLGDELIALEQVAQSAFRVAGLVGDIPHGASAFERRQPELGRRDEPDAMVRITQQRLHEVWQQAEALGDEALIRRERQQILDDQAEAFAPEPVKKFQARSAASGRSASGPCSSSRTRSGLDSPQAAIDAHGRPSPRRSNGAAGRACRPVRTSSRAGWAATERGDGSYRMLFLRTKH
jgi:hypothetical protein